jgi:hypothetical protein
MGHPKAHFSTRGWVGGGYFLTSIQEKRVFYLGWSEKKFFLKEKVLKICHQN